MLSRHVLIFCKPDLDWILSKQCGMDLMWAGQAELWHNTKWLSSSTLAKVWNIVDDIQHPALPVVSAASDCRAVRTAPPCAPCRPPCSPAAPAGTGSLPVNMYYNHVRLPYIYIYITFRYWFSSCKYVLQPCLFKIYITFVMLLSGTGSLPVNKYYNHVRLHYIYIYIYIYNIYMLRL